jgi:putative transposase
LVDHGHGGDVTAMRWLYHPLLLLIASSTDSDMARQLEFLKAENLMLRRRLPRNVRPTAAEWDLLLRLGRAVGNAGVRALITVVTYKSWLRRHRAARQRASEPVVNWRPHGRPRTPEHVRELVVRLARENASWGYTRVLGELRKLGIRTSRSNVINILRGQGHDPRTDPAKGTWAEFLRAHAATLWQCDFFFKYVATPEGALRQCFALAFVHAASRRVWVSPSTMRPDAAWVVRQAEAFVAHAAAAGPPAGIVLRDNDTRFVPAFDATLTASGATVIRLAIRAPNTNAYVERFVQSVKQECLDHFALCGTEHVDHLVREYLAYYHAERPHQGKGNRPLTFDGREPLDEGEVLCRERLGGLLKHYFRSAA